MRLTRLQSVIALAITSLMFGPNGVSRAGDDCGCEYYAAPA